MEHDIFFPYFAVIFPVVVGGFLSYLLTHRWQEYNHKMESKKELIQSFHYSIFAGFNLQHTLFRNIERYLGIEETRQTFEYDVSDSEICEIISGKKLIDLSNYNKDFKKKYESFKQEFVIPRHEIYLLNSKLGLYLNSHDADESQKKLKKLTNASFDVSVLLSNLVICCNADDIFNLIIRIRSELKTNHKNNTLYGNELRKLHISKIPI